MTRCSTRYKPPGAINRIIINQAIAMSPISSLIICIATITSINSKPQGFHFNRFSGPVSGPISRVEVPGHSIDYVAKPDYNFAYGVEDPLTGNYQNQKEVRDGDVVKGEYSVVDADGITRRVTYTADPRNGFQATVHTSEPNHEHASQQARFAQTLPRQSEPQQHYPQHRQNYNDGRYEEDDY